MGGTRVDSRVARYSLALILSWGSDSAIAGADHKDKCVRARLGSPSKPSAYRQESENRKLEKQLLERQRQWSDRALYILPTISSRL